MLKIQWFGHSAVKLYTATHQILIDPFFTGNETAPSGWEQASRDATHILLTHGHSDHVGDTVAIAKKHKIPVIAMVELAAWLQKQGVTTTREMNFGGTLDIGHGHIVSMVPAWHSSATDDGTYLGNPAGLVVHAPGGHSVYHAGDTSIFGDMALIEEMHKPTVGLLPVGGVYTMDGAAAALACRKYFNFKHIIPLHYGTFPVLAPDASAFTAAGAGLPIHVMEPGHELVV